MAKPFEETCYATFNQDAWDRPCGGDVRYVRRADLFLCQFHEEEYLSWSVKESAK